MKSYSPIQYVDAGCEEILKPAMLGVHGATGGRVCDTGCFAYSNGKCPAYKKLVAEPKVVKPSKYNTTNKQFAREHQLFISCCEEASIPPTPRQASKFRRKLGKAYTMIPTVKAKAQAAATVAAK